MNVVLMWTISMPIQTAARSLITFLRLKYYLWPEFCWCCSICNVEYNLPIAIPFSFSFPVTFITLHTVNKTIESSLFASKSERGF